MIASGEARRAQLSDLRRVQVLSRDGAVRWHPIWDGNPRLARPGEAGDFQTITNAPGVRPYIDHKSERRWAWKPYQCEPGELYLTAAEKEFGAQYRPQVVIEPTIKARASPNKQWGDARWRQFARFAREEGYTLAQLGPPGSRPLPRVTMIETRDFRLACAVLANAKAYVGPDGGLHHAAAALGVPAIVIRGGFISHRCTGYASQRNLFVGEGLGCGMRIPCAHCAAAMASISPENVLDELKGIL